MYQGASQAPGFATFVYDKGPGVGNLHERKQPANFRWNCVLHAFIHPNLGSMELKKVPGSSSYLNFWNHIRRLGNTYSFYEVRYDYVFLFAEKGNDTTYRVWTKTMEQNFDAQMAAYFYLVIAPLITTQSTCKISKILLLCPLCQHKKLSFIEYPTTYFQTRLEWDVAFHWALSQRHPNNSLELTDMSYTGPLNQIIPSTQPSFRTFSQFDNTDITTLCLIQPQNSTFRIIAVRQNGPDFKELDPLLPWITIRYVNFHYLRSYETSFNFLTCDGLKSFPRPSFYFFFSAYTVNTWLLILACALALAATLKFIYFIHDIQLNPMLIPLSVFVEQGVELGNRRVSLSCLMGIWFMICVILSNAYKGQNISDLTAPLKPLLFETFDDLVQANFTFYSRRFLIYQLDKRDYIEYPGNRSDFTVGVNKFQSTINTNPKIWPNNPQHPWNSKKYEGLRNLVSGILERTVPLSRTEGKELIETVLDCNRTALVDEIDPVDVLELELRGIRPTAFVAKGKFPILRLIGGWDIAQSRDPTMYGKLQRIVQSGVRSMWERYRKYLSLIRIRSKSRGLERNLTVNSTNNDEHESDTTKPLSLEGNLKIVFFLFGITVCIGCMVFLGELIYLLYRKVHLKIKWRKVRVF
jgi:hypothetical protein